MQQINENIRNLQWHLFQNNLDKLLRIFNEAREVFGIAVRA